MAYINNAGAARSAPHAGIQHWMFWAWVSCIPAPYLDMHHPCTSLFSVLGSPPAPQPSLCLLQNDNTPDTNGGIVKSDWASVDWGKIAFLQRIGLKPWYSR